MAKVRPVWRHEQRCPNVHPGPLSEDCLGALGVARKRLTELVLASNHAGCMTETYLAIDGGRLVS